MEIMPVLYLAGEDSIFYTIIKHKLSKQMFHEISPQHNNFCIYFYFPRLNCHCKFQNLGSRSTPRFEMIFALKNKHFTQQRI